MTISVSGDEAANFARMRESFLRAWETGEYEGESYVFHSAAQLFEVFPPRRWELIRTLHALGPSSLRGLARALERDVKRVHDDVAALIAEGIIEWNDKKKLVVPFERIHIDADLVSSAVAAE